MFYIENALSQLDARFLITEWTRECTVEISRDFLGNDTGKIKSLSPINYNILSAGEDNILISTIWEELNLDIFTACENNLFIDLQWFIRVAGSNHYFAISNKFTFFKCTEAEFDFINKWLWEVSKENENIYYIVTYGWNKIELYNRNTCIFTLEEKRIDYKDTIWAWDTFFASFVYYFSEGNPLNKSILLASIFTQVFLKEKNKPYT